MNKVRLPFLEPCRKIRLVLTADIIRIDFFNILVCLFNRAGQREVCVDVPAKIINKSSILGSHEHTFRRAVDPLTREAPVNHDCTGYRISR